MTTGTALAGRLRAAVQAQLPAAVELRHQVHREPDLGGHEDRTAERVAAALGDPGAPWVTQGRLVAVPAGDGPHIAIRAELDALPITEATGAPWASTNGAMHACGHDVHLAALVAVGRAVAAAGGPNPLLAVLQPREESLPSGAKDVLASAELAGFGVGAFLGAHLHPSLPAGTVGAQAGPVNASADDFTITITGQPSHAAYPHLGRDPIVAAAGTVLALQHLVSRRISPMHPSVLTIGALHAGTVGNAIPGSAELTGTLRAFDEADRAALHAMLTETTELTARSYGCRAEVSLGLGEPVLRNDAALAAASAPWLAEFGLDPDGDMRSCGSDDFAWYNGSFPALMSFVGVGHATVPGLHHPQFLPPDEAIADVAMVMLAGYLGACDVLAGRAGAAAAGAPPGAAVTPGPAATFDAAATSLLVGTIVDNAGITRAKSVPGDRIGAAVDSGIGLSPVFAVMCADDHLTRTDRYGGPAGDMRLRPDLSAAAVIDAGHGVAWAPLDQYDQDGEVMETCQRGVLKRQEAAARSAGLDFLMAYEVEFTVFTGQYTGPAHAGPGYGLRPWLQLEEFGRALLTALASAGVAVEQLHPEYGAGQLEISVAPRSPVAAADQYVLARLVIERTARQHGLTVSFAPRTVPGAIGNGAHLHFSASRDGRNVFAGGDGPHGLTRAGAAMIGGLVAYLPEAAGLLAPSVVSYARLVPGMWSGAYACWGLENREAAVRFIRGAAGSRGAGANAEVKCIDGASNPYLAAAAVLAMALAGLAGGLPAPEPADADPDALTAAAREQAGIRRLPDSLPAALTLLEGSEVLRDALGGAVVDCLVAVRRYEVDRYGQLPEDERIALLVSRY